MCGSSEKSHELLLLSGEGEEPSEGRSFLGEFLGLVLIFCQWFTSLCVVELEDWAVSYQNVYRKNVSSLLRPQGLVNCESLTGKWVLGSWIWVFRQSYMEGKKMGLLGIKIPAVLESAWVQAAFCREGATVVTARAWSLVVSDSGLSHSSSAGELCSQCNPLTFSLELWLFFFWILLIFEHVIFIFSLPVFIVWKTGDALDSFNIYISDFFLLFHWLG